MNQREDDVLLWLANGRTGVSSETMAFWLAFKIRPQRRCHPLDPADFNRCLGLLRAAPHLKPKLKQMERMSKHWSALVARWDEVEASLRAEVGDDWHSNRAAAATKTYALMQEIYKGVEQNV